MAMSKKNRVILKVRGTNERYEVYGCLARMNDMGEGICYYGLIVRPCKRGGVLDMEQFAHLDLPMKVRSKYKHVKATECGHF